VRSENGYGFFEARSENGSGFGDMGGTPPTKNFSEYPPSRVMSLPLLGNVVYDDEDHFLHRSPPRRR